MFGLLASGMVSTTRLSDFPLVAFGVALLLVLVVIASLKTRQHRLLVVPMFLLPALFLVLATALNRAVVREARSTLDRNPANLSPTNRREELESRLSPLEDLGVGVEAQKLKDELKAEIDASVLRELDQLSEQAARLLGSDTGADLAARQTQINRLLAEIENCSDRILERNLRVPPEHAIFTLGLRLVEERAVLTAQILLANPQQLETLQGAAACRDALQRLLLPGSQMTSRQLGRELWTEAASAIRTGRSLDITSVFIQLQFQAVPPGRLEGRTFTGSPALVVQSLFPEHVVYQGELSHHLDSRLAVRRDPAKTYPSGSRMQTEQIYRFLGLVEFEQRLGGTVSIPLLEESSEPAWLVVLRQTVTEVQHMDEYLR